MYRIEYHNRPPVGAVMSGPGTTACVEDHRTPEPLCCILSANTSTVHVHLSNRCTKMIVYE